jgi:hypothetical protein
MSHACIKGQEHLANMQIGTMMEDWYNELADPAEGAADPAFERLMASVGHLLFKWSLLEDALIDEIRRLRLEGGGTQTSIIRVRGSFSERLAEWRALLSLKSRRNPGLTTTVTGLANQMEQLRQTRNLVADQFAGASARKEEGEPFICCSQGERGASKGAVRRISQSELTKVIADIDASRRALRQVKSLEPPPGSG